MGVTTWIGGIIGWAAGGPLGAFLGAGLGAVVESLLEAVASPAQPGETAGAPNPQRNSFLVSLLVLSSAVIKADGTVHAKELNYVREYLRQQFGDRMAEEAMRVLSEMNRRDVNIYEVGPQIAANMNASQRLQLFHYLVRIALADGEFSKSEKDLLEVIASVIRIPPSDAQSILAMYYKETDSAYSVLEISPSATDDEVRSAYRRMAMKHHPDKVATLGPDVQKAAAEKFRNIQDAYETIKRQRGMA